MERELIVASIGGQGIQLLGMTLALAATREGRSWSTILAHHRFSESIVEWVTPDGPVVVNSAARGEKTYPNGELVS